MDEVLDGVPKEEQYPYNPFIPNAGICTDEDRVYVSDEYYGYYDLNDDEIIALLQDGPKACTISADGWSYYSSGIYECSYYPSLNHVVLLVGYTEEYWILKNEWG